jgi:hypothetical protein
MSKDWFRQLYSGQFDSICINKWYDGGPGGIRTHDLSNANAVSYRTRRPAHATNEQFYLVINSFNEETTL